MTDLGIVLHSHSLVYSTQAKQDLQYNHLVTRKSGNKYYIIIYTNVMPIKIILDISLHTLLSICWVSQLDVPWVILIHSGMNSTLPMSRNIPLFLCIPPVSSPLHTAVLCIWVCLSGPLPLRSGLWTVVGPMIPTQQYLHRFHMFERFHDIQIELAA